MLAALTFAVLSARPPRDSCAAMERRAIAFAPVRTVSGAEGMLQIVAQREHWYGGALTYAFAKSAEQPPSCAGENVTLEREGFSFERASDLSFEALAAIYGSAVAEDFARAKLVAATRSFDQPRDKPMRWFLGKIYGYSSLTGSNSLAVMPLLDFKAALAGALRAQRAVR